MSYSSVVSANDGLGAGDDLEAFAFQRVAETLREIDVAVDQQNLGGAAGDHHDSASARAVRRAAERLGAGRE